MISRSVALGSMSGLCALVALALPVLSLAQATPTLEQRRTAATVVATQHPACALASGFYWEIGNASEPLHGGQVAGGLLQPGPTRDKQMPVYSASKWVYGAYVYQKRGGVLDPAGTAPAAEPVDLSDSAVLTLRSGYVKKTAACTLSLTVNACAGTMTETEAAPRRFAYGPGHFQQHAAAAAPIGMGLGAYNRTQLAAEIHNQLGHDWIFTYNAPQLAGGGRSSAADYSVFLRKMLGGQLLMSGTVLGSQSVCTDRNDPDCVPTPRYSPAEEDPALPQGWRYSLGHWVETGSSGDGAFSSPGYGGFYPWIDAGRQYYGLLARDASGASAAGQSVRCGQEIRRAWQDGRCGTLAGCPAGQE